MPSVCGDETDGQQMELLQIAYKGHGISSAYLFASAANMLWWMSSKKLQSVTNLLSLLCGWRRCCWWQGTREGYVNKVSFRPYGKREDGQILIYYRANILRWNTPAIQTEQRPPTKKWKFLQSRKLTRPAQHFPNLVQCKKYLQVN